MSLDILFHFLCAQHVSDINISIIRSLRLCCASACKTSTTQHQPHKISNTQRTENKTTNVVIQQHSRKLLMMDILISETCWAHKKWNKIASDIKFVFHSSTVCLASETSFSCLSSGPASKFRNSTAFTDRFLPHLLLLIIPRQTIISHYMTYWERLQ